MAVLWVKKLGGDPFQYPVGPQGIFILKLAERLQLRASSLLLSGVAPEFSSPGYMSLAEAESYLPGLGSSADTAIAVTGEPAAPPPAAAAAAAAAGVSQTGSLGEGGLFLDVQLECGAVLCNASVLVDTGCDLDLNLSEYKANQLGLAPDGLTACIKMGQGHTGQILRRGTVLTTLMLAGEGEEQVKDPRRSQYLTVWSDVGTAGGSSSSSAARTTPSGACPCSSAEAAEGSVLKIKVLSPIRQGKDSRGYDAILGATGMARLNLGIDRDTLRLYRKQTRPTYRKLVGRQQQQQQQSSGGAE